MHKFIYFWVNYFLRIHQNQVYSNYRHKYQIDSSFKFNGTNIIFTGKGKIICNKNSYIGIGASISTNEGYKVIIGENCAISHNVRMYNNSYITDSDFNQLNKPRKYGDIIIGNGVWIGANTVILPGVSIGDNSVVGANSVVSQDIPPNCISSGSPCKVIRQKKGYVN